METQNTGGEMFGGIDFNADVVFDVSPTGEVVGSKIAGKETAPETKTPLEEIIEASKGTETKDKGGIQETEDKPQEESAPSSPSDPITLFASALSESGAIVADDEKVAAAKTFDDLVDLVKDTINKNELADLSDEAKQAVSDLRAGVPLKVVKQHHNAQAQLAEITEDQFVEAQTDDDGAVEYKQKVRKQLIVQGYISSGYSPERAEKLAQRSIDIGEDTEDAKAAVKDLQLADQRIMDNERANAESRKVEAQRHLKNLEQQVMSTEEILPGIPVSEKLRKQVFDSMTKPVEGGPQGAVYEIQKDRAKDPIAFDLRLHYLYALGLFKETPDMSVLTRTEKSKAAKQFQNAVSQHNFGGGGNNPQVHGATDESLLDSLDSMKF